MSDRRSDGSSGRPEAELVLSDEERERLSRWARRAKSTQALASRSRIVLASSWGADTKTVAAELGCAGATVGKWRSRFVEYQLDELGDEPRPGRPKSITVDKVEDLIVTTLEKAPANATHWNRSKRAQRTGLAKSTIGRNWRGLELKPHRVAGFKLSNDPLFEEKVHDIRRAIPEPLGGRSRVVRGREIPGSGLGAPAASLPMMPGMPEKRTHDYIRHGTISLFAAMNGADGAVISATHRRHRAVGFRKFLNRIDYPVPADLVVHLIADNYATHKHPIIVRWLGAHPGSKCTSPRPTPLGSTKYPSSPTLPQTCCNAPTTAASKHSKPIYARMGPRPGTTTPAGITLLGVVARVTVLVGIVIAMMGAHLEPSGRGPADAHEWGVVVTCAPSEKCWASASRSVHT